MAPHTWIRLGADSGAASVLNISDRNHRMIYRGQEISEAIYRGNVVWKKSAAQPVYEICFWDWDGALVAAFSAASFVTICNTVLGENGGVADLTWELFWGYFGLAAIHRRWTAGMISPPNEYKNLPARYDKTEVLLTPAGYNFDIRTVYAYAFAFRRCDIGLLYECPGIVAWVAVPNNQFRCVIHGDASVDFGDGATATIPSSVSTFVPFTEHTYAESGLYIVKTTGPVTIGGMSVLDGGAQQISMMYSFDTRTNATAGIGGVDAASPVSYVYACYLGSTSGASVGAFKQTLIKHIGLGASSSLSLHSTFENTAYLEHLNLPRSVTTLGTDVRTTYDTMFWVDDGVFGRASEPSLKRIILPNEWTGPLYLNGSGRMEEIIFPAHCSDTLGRLHNLSGHFKKAWVFSGVVALTPEYMDLTFSSINHEFEFRVPYALDLQYLTGDSSQAGSWMVGETLWKQVLASQSGTLGRDLSPYVKAADRLLDYWSYSLILDWL